MEYKDLIKGMTVTYIPASHRQRVPYGGANDYIGREVGKVTSWNESYVFVDYDNCGRGKPTKIDDLVKGDQSFYCADEWNSVTDGAFGRCGSRCSYCSGSL